MPRALVTGGAGFIGSHVATSLALDGWEVRVLDNLSTGNKNNLAHIQERVTFIQGDIRDGKLLSEVMNGVDVVFHKAALVSVPLSVEDPMAAHSICASGTMEVLLAARNAKVRRVVYAASSSAYGDVARCPSKEDDPLAPKSPYAAAKLAGEHYCSAMSAISSLETVRLRYFNVFGPRQDPSSPYSGVISIFSKLMHQGKAPMIYGDGLQSRDFVYVDNVVQANRLAAEAPGVSGQVFNIGCGGRQTLLELAAAMNQVLGTNLAPLFAQPRTGDVRDSQADITAARQCLGYEPKVPFEEGLARCLEYYRSIA